MLVVPEHTCPLICVAVSKGTELNQVVRFGTINPNSTSSWFTEAGEDQLRLTEQDCVPHADWAKPSVVLCCRHTADVCDSHHSARERHYLGLPGQWVTRVLTSVYLPCGVSSIWAMEHISPRPSAGCIKIVNLQGRLKSSRKLSAELTFNFQIEATGKSNQATFLRFNRLKNWNEN